MEIIAIVLILIIYIKTMCYGMYEIKENKNKSGGTTVMLVSSLICIFTLITIFMS